MPARSDRSTDPMNRRRPARAMVAAMVVAGLAALGLTAPAVALEPAPTAPSARTVSYRGWTGVVPDGWAVVDLAADPSACVRFDRHAVYLGSPGQAQECPASLLGRTEALLVEPVESPSDQTPVDVTAPGPSITGVVPADASTTSEVRVAVPSAGVRITATWNGDPASVSAVLASGSVTPGWVPTPAEPPVPQPRTTTGDRIVGVRGYQGMGFDACTAPSTASMNTWLASPYRAVGVYIGGNNRACSQANLTASWVDTTTSTGWQVMPIYVGYQAPVNICRCAALTTGVADSQGVAAADDAVAKARGLGMAAGSPIYFDMEEYGRGSTNTPGVVRFLSAWTNRLHQLGYQSGVYGGTYSVLPDLIAAGSTIAQPDTIWYANWDGRNATLGDRNLPDSLWTHSRIHQYSTGNDTWGGLTLSVDRDAIDTTLVGSVDADPRDPVAPPPPTPSVPPATVRDYISRVYWADVNRGPSADESNFWTWVLSTGTPAAALSNGLLRSGEWAQYQAASQYLILLRRSADAGGMQYWTQWMTANRNPDGMAAAMASSSEYWFDSGWKADAWVTNLYRDLLGRSPDPGGLAYWSARVRAGESRYTIALTVALSRERSEIVVRNGYRLLLRRAADPGGLASFVSLFEQTRDPASVLLPLATSPEAINLR